MFFFVSIILTGKVLSILKSSFKLSYLIIYYLVLMFVFILLYGTEVYNSHCMVLCMCFRYVRCGRLSPLYLLLILLKFIYTLIIIC